MMQSTRLARLGPVPSPSRGLESDGKNSTDINTYTTSDDSRILEYYQYGAMRICRYAVSKGT